MGIAKRLVTFVAVFAMLGLTPHGLPLAQTQTDEPAVETEPADRPDNENRDAPDSSEPAEDGLTEEAEPKADEETAESSDIDDITPPDILRDLSLLPFPTRRMHELLLEAAKSGDIERLRPYIGYGDDVTMLSLGGIDEDPISFLKSLSGDSEGHELLAILAEVLETGFVHMDAGTEQEIFVWPYFFAQPLDKLTPAQRVELFSVVTYGDYEDMAAFGAYIFYRVGITPEGRWRFFVAGD